MAQDSEKVNDADLDDTRSKCLSIARILHRYRDYLLRTVKGLDLVEKLKEVINPIEYQELKAYKDGNMAALFLVIRHLESRMLDTFEKFLEILDESDPCVGSIIKKNGELTVNSELESRHIIRCVQKYSPFLLACLDMNGLIRDDLSPALNVIERFYILSCITEYEQNFAFLTLLADKLKAGHFLLWELLLTALKFLQPELHDQILSSSKTNSTKDNEILNDPEQAKAKCAQYIQTLEKNRQLITGEIPMEQFLPLLSRNEFLIRCGIICEFESMESFIDCIIAELEQKSYYLYEVFLTALSQTNLYIYSQMFSRCEFAKWTIKTHCAVLVSDLDVDSVVATIKTSLSKAELSEIESEENVMAKTHKLLEFINMRLAGKDLTLFDEFLDALAGLEKELFFQLAGRVPSIKEAELCINRKITELKANIVDIGHQSDKKKDRIIDLEKEYIRLRVMHTEENSPDIQNTIPTDSVHPMMYQAMLSKSDIDVEDIMENLSNAGRFCLIQGRCGIGKTTMAQHLCRRWAKEKCLKHFSLIFLIPIRRLMVYKLEVSLHELLTKYTLYKSDIPLRWLDNWSQHVLLYIDGLDELSKFAEKMDCTRGISDISEKAMPEELIINILKCNLLPKSTLLCSTRPFSTLSQLQPHINLEVMGLTEDGVLEYIEKNVPSEFQAKVTAKLKENPVLMSVCSITYYASVMCTILAREQPSSTNNFETYSRLTASLVLSYPVRQSAEKHEQMKCETTFPVLAEIALHTNTMNEREPGLTNISIDMDDLPRREDLIKSVKIAEAYGLVQITEDINEDINGEVRSILEFPHLSVQEFFAALQLLRVRDAADISMENEISKILRASSLNMFHLFIFGAAMDVGSKNLKCMRKNVMSSDKFQEGQIKRTLMKCLDSLLADTMSSREILKVCQIAYETQSSEFSKQVCFRLLRAQSSLIFEGMPLNALDIKAITFCVGDSNLQHVKLSNVNLDDYSVGILVKCMKRNKILKSLDLSHNQIKKDGLSTLSELLETIPGLEELRLNGNSINSSSFCSLIPGLYKKRCTFALSIGGNCIQDEGAEDLASSLMNTNALVGLEISYNSIGLRGMDAIENLVAKVGDFTILDLDGAPAGDNLIQCLFVNSQKHALLTNLSLNDTLVTNVGATSLAENIHRLTSLAFLGLRGCQIGTQGAQNIIQAVKGRDIHIDLQNNQIDVTRVEITANTLLASNLLGKDRLRRISDDMSRGKVFRTLDLSECQIQDSDVGMMVKMFMHNCNLEEISLCNNDITSKVYQHLIHLAFTCPKLKRINLHLTHLDQQMQKDFLDMSVRYKWEAIDISGQMVGVPLLRCMATSLQESNTLVKVVKANQCYFQEGHFIQFCGILKSNSTVTELQLMDSEIGVDGASVLCELLGQNKCLEKIHLNNNKLKPKCGIIIATKLAENSSLKEIHMKGNKIGSKAAEALLQSLEKTTRITHINLSNNRLGEEGGKVIAAIIMRVSNLTSIYVAENDIGIEGGAAIGNALLQNSSLREINLRENRIGIEGGKTIGQALVQNSSLIQINLSGNRIGVEGGKVIGKALALNSSLTQIDLSANQIGEEGGKAIGEALAQNSSLTIIDLCQNGLGVAGGKAIGEALARNSSLTQIYLSDNGIGVEVGVVIADALTQNSSLTHIDLSGNGIGLIGGKAMGEALVQNSSLAHIDLSRNGIGVEGGKAISVALPLMKLLTKIDLSWNGIGDEGGKAISEALAQNSSLTVLTLRHNGIGVEGGKAIGEILANNSSLTQIDLSHNSIGVEGGKAIGQALAVNSSLNQIHLSHNGLGDEGGKAIGEALVKNSSLTHIDLSDNGLGEECGKAIGEALVQNSSVTQIDLSANGIGDEGGKAIGEALAQNLSLTQIDLSQNRMGVEGGKVIGKGLGQYSFLTQIHLGGNGIGIGGGKAIGVSLPQNSSLTHIDLSGIRVGEEGGKTIAVALAQNLSLTQIELSDNGICAEGGKAIGKALAKNLSLRHIGLSYNEIGDEGGITIAEALIQNSSLTHIDLSDNRIRVEGGIVIADALTQNSSLTHIDLSGNGIGLIGGKAMAKALSQNSSLTQIDLSHNGIGVEGGKAIGVALVQNSSLTRIHLSWNGIGDEGAKTIAEALAQNSSLTEIYLYSNGIGEVGGKAIGEALVQNSSLNLIDLSCNGIGIVGGKAIGKALAQNSSLTQINLSCTGIEVEGGKAIGEALVQNSSLTQIDISHNGMQKEGGKSIGKALAQNSSLTQIDLSGNGIGTQGVKAIGVALAQNSYLFQIHLNCNKIGDEGAKAIGEALAQNSSLTQINLIDNGIGVEGGIAIGKALAHNSSLTQIDLSCNGIGVEGGKAIGEALAQNSSLTQIDLRGNRIGDEALCACLSFPWVKVKV